MDPRALKLRMLKRVFTPPEVCVGRGSIERLACFDPDRVLVVGRTSQLPSLPSCEVLAIPYAGTPSLRALDPLWVQVAEFAPTWIIAIGGGSAMDAAKFLWAKYEHPELAFSEKAPVAIGPLRQKARFVAVPTTAGSGSEASQAAVLTAGDGAKVPYISPEWVPDLVILDPALTVSLPRELTIATGFDALAHAVESSVSPLGNPLLQALAATAIDLILRHLHVAAEKPGDLAAREGMLEAAYLAGLCQSTASTGAAHALSHATSKLHQAPHATATAFYLLPAMRWNRKKNPALYDRFEAIVDLATGLVPQTFADLLGRPLDASERQALAEAAAKDICLRTNPYRMNAAGLSQLLAEIG